jgi:hypothetical protein
MLILPGAGGCDRRRPPLSRPLSADGSAKGADSYSVPSDPSSPGYSPSMAPPSTARGGAPIDESEILFQRAKEFARQERYDEAQELALKARRTIESAPGYGKDHAAIERVRLLTELIVLCRKSVAGSGSTGGAQPNPVPYNSAPWGTYDIPPPGTVRPPSVSSPSSNPAVKTPTWSDLNLGIAGFVTILDELKPTHPPPAEKVNAAIAELGKFIPMASTDLAPLAYGAYGTLRMVRQGIWNPAEDEIAVLHDYVRGHLSKPATLSDTEAIAFLVKALDRLRMNLPGERRSATRWMALAHIERLVSNGFKTRVQISPHDVELLGLAPHNDVWVTAESRLKDELASLGPEDLDKSVDALLARPDREARVMVLRTLFLRIFESFGADQQEYIEEMKKRAAGFDVGSAEIREEMSRIRAALSKSKPCARCKGTHEARCTNGCNDNGEFVKVCGHCQGTGRVTYQGREVPCPNRQIRGEHREASPCGKCKGTKRVECRSCKEPWKPPALESMVKVSPCPLCHQSGFLRGYLRLLCPDCFGIGRRFEAPTK